MKKAIFVGVLSLLFVGSAQASNCASGDLFDTSTGAACASSNSSDASLIASLRQQIALLTSELQQYKSQTIGVVTPSFQPISENGMTITGITPDYITSQQVTFGPYQRAQITVYGSNLCGSNVCTDANKPYVYVENQYGNTSQQIVVDSYSSNGTSLTFTVPTGISLNATSDAVGNVSNSITFSIGANWQKIFSSHIVVNLGSNQKEPTSVISFTLPVNN